MQGQLTQQPFLSFVFEKEKTNNNNNNMKDTLGQEWLGLLWHKSFTKAIRNFRYVYNSSTFYMKFFLGNIILSENLFVPKLEIILMIGVLT